MAAARRTDDPAQVPRVHFRHGHRAAPSEKTACALRIAVAAPHRMSLLLKQLCEEGSGRAGTQNEDPHGVPKLYHIPGGHSRECQDVCLRMHPGRTLFATPTCADLTGYNPWPPGDAGGCFGRLRVQGETP